VVLLATAVADLPGSRGWRIALGLAMLPAIVLTVGGILLPETPNSLCERGITELARRYLCRIRGTQEVDAEFEDIQEAARIACEVPINLSAVAYRFHSHHLLLVFGEDGVCPSCIQTCRACCCTLRFVARHLCVTCVEASLAWRHLGSSAVLCCCVDQAPLEEPL